MKEPLQCGALRHQLHRLGHERHRPFVL